MVTSTEHYWVTFRERRSHNRRGPEALKNLSGERRRAAAFKKGFSGVLEISRNSSAELLS